MVADSFFHLLFISVVALFPVVNPIGTALIVNPYLSQLEESHKKSAVNKITIYAFAICVFCLFAGHFILKIFGISIPVIQLAGGIMICKTGWEWLTSDKTSASFKSNSSSEVKVSIDDKLFYPITFPITTGAGTISVLFTLGAQSETENFENYLLNTGAILVAIIIMCILIRIFYVNTDVILKYLGSHSENIVNRLMAFLLFCVGLQIAVTGVKALL
ncbi:MAG: MarC family protein [Cytophagaceae bacterium]